MFTQVYGGERVAVKLEGSPVLYYVVVYIQYILVSSVP